MHKQTENSDEFATSDLYFAAYLQTSGAPMRHERRSGKVSFIFDTTVVNVEELTQAWYSQSGKIVALAYANNIKNLKAICHMQ